MAELKLSHEPTREELRAHMRSLSGSEQKALNAVFVLEEAGEPTTAEAIALEANLSRATVFRALARLTAAAYIEYHTTPTGRRIAAYSLSILGQAISNTMVGLHNRQTDTPGEHSTHNSPPKNEIRVADFPGLTGNFETPVSNFHSREHEIAETGQQVTRLKQESNNLGYPATPNRDIKARALELAKRSAQILDDNHSVGLHITVWTQAITHDKLNGNDRCENELNQLLYVLRARKQEQQRPQGAAWTKRTKQLITEWGDLLRSNRQAATAPAGNQGEVQR